MKKAFLFLSLLFSISIFSHTINYENQILRHWNIQNEHFQLDGSFSMMKNGMVYIEDAQNNITKYPFSSFCKADKTYIKNREAEIIALNSKVLISKNEKDSTLYYYKLFIIGFLLIGFIYFIIKLTANNKLKYVLPILLLGVLMTLYSFTKKILTITDPSFVNSAFMPFVPNVATSWDDTYFYVESKGIPNHTMMVGISDHGWQQQVPIPQCYIGTNHWSIPLNPVIASTPIAIDNIHFTRGAIAIAANGVPIFNYHTNTGVDSYTEGQLDNYGGHSGRGDDYHYHIAPLHLYTSGQTTPNLPCAFSLDGFAVYGSVEPDGSSMQALDANHGHYGINGVYHYHGTATAPYMIGNFVGQVTEDATYQLIPQATAHPVRTENWTPLPGALINSLVPNGLNNGYNLSYTLNGIPGYGINYSWNGIVYTFNYISPTGTTTTIYNHGFTQCSVPLGLNSTVLESSIKMYPNPVKDVLNIIIGNTSIENQIQSISIVGIKGELLIKTDKFKNSIDIKNFSKGTYFVKIQLGSTLITKKIIIE